ncbi:uncharacterized protein METZ01_LOCUS392117, partial [marine metagenome]
MVPKTCAYRLPDGSQCTEDFFGFGGEAEYCWKHQAYQNMTDEEKEKRKQIDDSIHALRNPDADIRLRAIWGDGGWEAHFTGGLGMFNDDSSAIDALASALDDDNTEVRREAVWALPSPDLRTEMHFVTALGDVDESVRRIAAKQLMLDENPFAPSGDTRVFEALISALDDESPDVREKAIISLGNRAHSQSSQALVNALKNDDFEVRWKAAYGLGTMNIRGVMKGSKEAVEPLIAALGDEKSFVRE